MNFITTSLLGRFRWSDGCSAWRRPFYAVRHHQLGNRMRGRKSTRRLHADIWIPRLDKSDFAILEGRRRNSTLICKNEMKPISIQPFGNVVWHLFEIFDNSANRNVYMRRNRKSVCRNFCECMFASMKCVFKKKLLSPSIIYTILEKIKKCPRRTEINEYFLIYGEECVR